ncbi:MAG: hypothetical protein AB7O97_06655 [Planctomycetota bacterium]
MNPTDKKTDTTTATPGSFTAANTMLEVLTADPSLGMVLMRDFHIGGCQNCGFDPHSTIAEVAQQNGVPTERLLAAMNRTA